MSSDFKVTLILLLIVSAIGYYFLNAPTSTTISKEEEARARAQIHFQGK